MAIEKGDKILYQDKNLMVIERKNGVIHYGGKVISNDKTYKSLSLPNMLAESLKNTRAGSIECSANLFRILARIEQVRNTKTLICKKV